MEDTCHQYLNQWRRMGLIKKIILYHIGCIVDGILLLILGGDGGERL